MPALERPPPADAVRLLAEGEVEVEGRLPWSSNASFVVTLCLDGVSGRAVYKPGRGERARADDQVSSAGRKVYSVSEFGLLGT